MLAAVKAAICWWYCPYTISAARKLPKILAARQVSLSAERCRSGWPVQVAEGETHCEKMYSGTLRHGKPCQ